MTDVNLQLVREWFELNVFRVLTNWQQEPWREQAVERSPQLFVENAQPGPSRELPFALHPLDLPAIERAVVHIRAWHGDRFYPSVIGSSPLLSGFEAEDAASIANHVFAGKPFVTILVISELPVSREQRQRSMNLLRESGADHMIEFPYILQDLIERVSVNANYAASPTLQMLRLLKRYKFIRYQQLELPFPVEPPVPRTPPVVEANQVGTEDEGE